MFRPGKSHPKTSDTQYIELLDHLNEAKVNLENAKDSIRDRVKGFHSVKKYLASELIREELDKLDVIKYRLKVLKEIIEEIEDAINEKL